PRPATPPRRGTGCSGSSAPGTRSRRRSCCPTSGARRRRRARRRQLRRRRSAPCRSWSAGPSPAAAPRRVVPRCRRRCRVRRVGWSWWSCSGPFSGEAELRVRPNLWNGLPRSIWTKYPGGPDGSPAVTGRPASGGRTSAVVTEVAALGHAGGVDGGLGAPVHPELQQQVRDVVLDRLLGEVHLLGDLAVGHPFGEVAEDLLLLRAQRGQLLVLGRWVAQPL